MATRVRDFSVAAKVVSGGFAGDDAEGAGVQGRSLSFVVPIFVMKWRGCEKSCMNEVLSLLLRTFLFPSMSSPGRHIRIALIMFPLGLVITSIASFGIWWWKRTQVEERSYGYATALRREMTVQSLDRYTSILKEVMQPTGPERLAAVASFVDSSMSAENMGYDPRRDRFFHGGLEVSNVDVEITGRPRWQEISLILVLYGDPGRTKEETQALAGIMALGHAITGERREGTLRLAAIPLGVVDSSGQTALERFAAAIFGRQERVMRVIIPGGLSEELLVKVRRAFRAEQSGTLFEVLPATTEVESTMKAMTALKAKL